jgi:hypothetical protein
MAKDNRYKAVQIIDGTWYRIKGYTHAECCDCALVHKEKYRLVDGQLEWMAERDDEATKARRKELGIKVIRNAKAHKRR